MNNEKEEIKSIKRLIKDIKKGYGANCPDMNIECGSCKAEILISLLEWHLDNIIEWNAGIISIKKELTKIKTKKNGLKKSKTNRKL